MNPQQELNTALLEACKQNHVEDARRLLDEGANPQTDEDSTVTPLIIAVQNGCDELAKLLLEKGAFVDGQALYSTPRYTTQPRPDTWA